MKSFSQYLKENKNEDIMSPDEIKLKYKTHNDQIKKLIKERSKHNKTSAQYKQISNDIKHHSYAADSYYDALDMLKHNSKPSLIKAKLEVANNHANKISGVIPEVAKKPEKIKNIHDYIHSKLINDGFEHHKEDKIQHTNWSIRNTPYGDDRSILL
jgi:hypothetical protein